MHYLIKHKLNTDTGRSKAGEKEEEQTIQVNAAKTLALIHNANDPNAHPQREPLFCRALGMLVKELLGRERRAMERARPCPVSVLSLSCNCSWQHVHMWGQQTAKQ